MKIERLLAHNPGPFTGPGTNTWLLDDGSGKLVVIDPGPIDPTHEQTINERIVGRDVLGVLVTHTHPDHAPMANPLARNLGVPAIGYGPGPEFDPDSVLIDGSELAVGQVTIAVVHTPGHSNDHLCFRVGDVLFSGDHIMGGSSVMVETMGPYLDSLRRLRGTGLDLIHPGHGDDIDDPDTIIDWYIAHRLQRHQEILVSIRNGARTVDEIVETVYAAVDSSLHPLAARSVRAHVALLIAEGQIALAGDDLVSEFPPTQ